MGCQIDDEQSQEGDRVGHIGGVFGGFLRKMMQIPEGILANSCAILGSVPWYVVQPTCRMLETFRGQTGTPALGNFWDIVQRSWGGGTRKHAESLGDRDQFLCPLSCDSLEKLCKVFFFEFG